MITTDDKLTIFENFAVDRSLPKYKKLAKLEKDRRNKYQQQSKQQHIDEVLDPQTYQIMQEENSENEDDDMYMPVRASSVIFSGNGEIKVNTGPLWKQESEKTSWLSKLAFWKSKPKPEPGPIMSIEEFFTAIRGPATQELTIIKERAAGYERAMQNAKQMGQHALYEQLAGGLNAYRMETFLVSIGLIKYVKEEDIVRFYKQSKRGLRLDWVHNFARAIPESVTTKKTQADEMDIFDNYVVLHYDPKAKAFAETEADKQRRKDPILFGVMQNRRVLYFVGDWVDEVCDLTLDQLAEHLGRDAIHTISDGKENGGPYRTPL